MKPPPKVIIHVGFCHSGTKSLQQNFFSRRSDIFYCGIPYGDRGGLFTFIKHQPDEKFDRIVAENWRDRFIYDLAAERPAIVISDECFTEQPEVYYTPAMLPLGTIAQRLKSFFPDAKILFTIRNQLHYVVSSYLNLKRNYASLAQRPIEEFSAWFEGNLSQVSNLFLRNLDYASAINLYTQLFGRKSVFVLPLECLEKHGVAAYLNELDAYFDLPVTASDIDSYAIRRNARLTAAEDLLLGFKRRARHFESFIDRMAASSFIARIIRESDPVKIELSTEQIKQIAMRVSAGNRVIAHEFNLPLEDYGYP